MEIVVVGGYEGHFGETDDAPTVSDGLQHGLIGPIVGVFGNRFLLATFHQGHGDDFACRREGAGMQVEEVLDWS